MIKKNIILIAAVLSFAAGCQTSSSKGEKTDSWWSNNYMTIQGVYANSSPDIPSYAPPLEDNEIFFDVEDDISEAGLKRFIEQEGCAFAFFEGQRPVVLIMPNNTVTTLSLPNNKTGFVIKLSPIQAKYIKGRHIYMLGKRSEGISQKKEWQFPPQATVYLITTIDPKTVWGTWLQPVPKMEGRRRGIILEKDGTASSVNPQYWAKKIIMEPIPSLQQPVAADTNPPAPQPQYAAQEDAQPTANDNALNSEQQPAAAPADAAAAPADTPAAQEPAAPKQNEIKAITRYEKWELKGNNLILSGKYVSKPPTENKPAKEPAPKDAQAAQGQPITEVSAAPAAPAAQEPAAQPQPKEEEQTFDFTEIYEIKENPSFFLMTLTTSDGKELKFERKE